MDDWEIEVEVSEVSGACFDGSLAGEAEEIFTTDSHALVEGAARDDLLLAIVEFVGVEGDLGHADDV